MFEYMQFLYASSSEALNLLKQKGYDIDYNLNRERILEHPEDFKIIYIFKYEGESSPEDSSTVYGIECLSTGERGVFVMGNPAFDNTSASQLLGLMEIEGRIDQKRGVVS